MSSTNRGSQRNEHDWYATPHSAVWAFMDRAVNNGFNLAQFKSTWLEPAIGPNAEIVRAIEKWCDYRNYPKKLSPSWDGFDIQESKLSPGESRLLQFWKQDFLKYEPLTGHNCYQVIMTNPPFSLAQEFVHKCLHLYDDFDNDPPVVIMLLRLGFLGSIKRSDWWQSHKPDALYVLSDRPDFTGDGGDSSEYAWYCWNWKERGIFVLPPFTWEPVDQLKLQV